MGFSPSLLRTEPCTFLAGGLTPKTRCIAAQSTCSPTSTPSSAAGSTSRSPESQPWRGRSPGISARIATHRERDRQANAEPVLDELRRLVDERSVSVRRRREWQHHDMQEQVNQRAINESANDGATDQKCKLAAGQIVDRSRAQCDHEMQDDAKRSRLCPSAIRPHAKDPAGNRLRNQDRFLRTVNQDRVSQVQYADNQASDKDGRKRPRPRKG